MDHVDLTDDAMRHQVAQPVEICLPDYAPLINEEVVDALRSRTESTPCQVPVMIAHQGRNVPADQLFAAFVNLGVVADHVAEAVDLCDIHPIQFGKHCLQGL